MFSFLTWAWRSRFPYEPLIRVEISQSRIIHNLEQFRKIAPHGRVAPVLKSNAYGHGLSEVAGILEHHRRSGGGDTKARIPFFVVDSYFEARALRMEHLRTPILVIGFTRPEIILNSRLRDVSYAVTSLDMLRHLEGATARVDIHLKIDIGMGRQGIRPDEVGQAIDMIESNDFIRLEGICGHFSDADNEDRATTEGQIKIWNRAVHTVREIVPTIEFIHVSNTHGHRFTQMCEANVSRLGIGLYGLAANSDFKPMLDLRPVLSMKSILTSLKTVRRDEKIGYSGTFKAERDMAVATIPAGYYEGIDRRLSNNGMVLVGQDLIPCPIVGRVSMNITSIDVTKAYGTKIGTEATIISDDPKQPNSILSMAKRCNTIPYEIAVHIPGQLRRVVV